MKEATSDERFDKIDAQLNSISNALIKGFDRLENKIETKADAADLQTALGLLDTLAKRQEISDDERLVMSHQLTRLHD